jgi:AmmeMemoRadiSam system protein B
MTGPKPGAWFGALGSETGVRRPAVAGSFYPDDERRCRALAAMYLARGAEAAASAQPAGVKWIGGIVPHAGWICSGAIAGQTISALSLACPAPDVVVVFGAIHSPVQTDVAALDSHGTWRVPGGDSRQPEEVERKLVESRELFAVDDRFHLHEHAVEVELPLIQQAWPSAAVLPIEVPVLENAVEIGVQTATKIRQAALSAVYLASSDLTHYGPGYRFMPAGVGPEALEWAKQNDRRLLTLVTDLRAELIVPEVRNSFNACGGGAISAMLAACKESGATRGTLLRHANSFETLAGVAPQRPDNAVGYAAVVIG